MNGRIISVFGVSKEATLTIEMIYSESQVAKSLTRQGLRLLKVQTGIFDSAGFMGGIVPVTSK